MKQEKIAIIILAVAVVAAAAGYGAWKFLGAREQSQETGEKTQAPLAPVQEETQTTTSYGTLPEIESTSNPLEKVPNLNPVEKANPFKDISTNPFK